ncbi:MAG: hypothetical protein KDK41_07300 [Leptospiraceae bacterium]|nr:hypothetical protein [Leptospiraceae bacterium]
MLYHGPLEGVKTVARRITVRKMKFREVTMTAIKHILKFWLLLAFVMVSAPVFSQDADAEAEAAKAAAAEAEAKKQEEIDVPKIKTITTRQGTSTVRSVPEQTTTVTVPERVLVKESLLTWLSIGARASMDYHFVPADGGISCLWLFGEVYNTIWGLEMGIGYMSAPIKTYTDLRGTSFTGTGNLNYIGVDAIGKYYLWFARWWWVGGGLNFASFANGYMSWFDNTVTGLAANPTDAQNLAGGAVRRYTPLEDVASQLYIQVGTGFRIAMGNGFNTINFVPDIRFLVPINSVAGKGTILRFNLGVSYSFGLL